ncbi:MAG: stage II sporulation protein R [Clostridia bacterium]|nr:stage II sporulation protein R [Clostridia bacterium]
MKKDFFISLALAAIILTACILNIVSFAQACDSVRRDVLRLHVVADSNSETDQKLKLLVRDAVLEKGGELFEGTVTVNTAKAEILPRIDELETAATKVLRENGCKNSVEITVTEEYFNTRCYEDFTMPAGVYTAVRVNIGSAQGQNWWCVMFPPLCLPAASTDADAFFTDAEMKVVSSSPEYEPRFKIVEIIESIKAKLKE